MQSLLGYDYIILGQVSKRNQARHSTHTHSPHTTHTFASSPLYSQPLHERDGELLEELRHTFRTFVREHYPEVRLSDIVRITASHYFGIVPLHVNTEHQMAYLQTASALLSSLSAMQLQLS